MVSFLHSFVWQHNSVRNILSFCRYFNQCHWSLSMLNVPLHCYWLKVGFPRDGTICELLSFWYETKIFSCLVVPLSRNKGRSKKKIVLKICTFFLTFFYFCPMSCPMAGLNKTGHAGNIPSKPIQAHLVARCQNPVPAHPMARFWTCPVVPLTWDDQGNSVPLSCGTRKSHPVGNASWKSYVVLPCAYLVSETRKWNQMVLTLVFVDSSGAKHHISFFFE